MENQKIKALNRNSDNRKLCGCPFQVVFRSSAMAVSLGLRKVLYFLTGGIILAMIPLNANADGSWFVEASDPGAEFLTPTIFGGAEVAPPAPVYYPWHAKRFTVWASWEMFYCIDGMAAFGELFDFPISSVDFLWNAIEKSKFDISKDSRRICARTTDFCGSVRVVSGRTISTDSIRVGYTFDREKLNMPLWGDDYRVVMQLATDARLARTDLQLAVYTDIYFVEPEIELTLKGANPVSGEITIGWDFTEKSKEYYARQKWDLKEDGIRVKIWRSSSEPNKWDDFFSAEPVEEGDDVPFKDRSFTDKTFGTAGGCSPIIYWVELKGSRQVNGRPFAEPKKIQTRNRYCVSVGMGHYDKTQWKGSPPVGHKHDVEEAEEFCKQLMDAQLGSESIGVSAILNRYGQTFIHNVTDELAKVCESAKFGDEVFFFIATHGNPYGLALADGIWEKEKIVEAIKPFASKGIKFIGVINACHGGAIAEAFKDMPFTAWIAAARNGEVAACWDDISGFGQVFLDWGLRNGYAKQQKVFSRNNKWERTGATSSGYVNLLEVAHYTDLLYPGRSQRITQEIWGNTLFKESHEQHVCCVNEELLSRTDVKYVGAIPEIGRTPAPQANWSENTVEGDGTSYPSRAIEATQDERFFKYEYIEHSITERLFGTWKWGDGMIPKGENKSAVCLYTKYEYDVTRCYSNDNRPDAEHYSRDFLQPGTKYDVRVRTLGPSGWSEPSETRLVTILPSADWFNAVVTSGKLAASAQVEMPGFFNPKQDIVVEFLGCESDGTLTAKVRIGDGIIESEPQNGGTWEPEDGLFWVVFRGLRPDPDTGAIHLNFDASTTAGGEDIGGSISLAISPQGFSGTWAGKTFNGNLYIRRSISNDIDVDDEDDEDVADPTQTIVFDANGGIADYSSVELKDWPSNWLLPNATREGYSLDAWYWMLPGIPSGVRITTPTIIPTSDVGTVNAIYRAQWKKGYNQVICTVTFRANGGAVSPVTRSAEKGSQIGSLPMPTRIGYTFDGWFTAATGGSKITESTKVSSDVTYYAHWTKNGGETPTPRPKPGTTPGGYGEMVLCDSVDGAAPLVAASEYNGYLYDENGGSVKGSIQVKVGKANAKTGLAAVKATVVGLDGKKKSLKAAEKGKAVIASDGPTAIALIGGEACEIVIGKDGLSGVYGAYTIDGARNFFTSKDKAEQNAANAILSKWLGVINAAWREEGAARSASAPYQMLSATIGKKGKAKASVTLANGTKAMVNTQLLVGEEWLCVPVVVTKKMNLAFTLWLPVGGGAAVTEGLGEEVVAGKAGALKAGAKFRIDAEAFSAKWGQSALPYLPDGVAVTQSGTRWTLPKAGKVQMAKDGTVDAAKLGDNPAALKLSYKAKDGSFKGSFKAYSLVNGKPKAVAVRVAGVVIDGVGYGSAAIGKSGQVAIEIR